MDIEPYVSDMSVLCGAERIQYTSGKAKGVDALHVFNGKLDFFVLLDRAMDIFRLSYEGTPISYISKNGLVNPHLMLTGAYPFLSSFEGGFLYTCGLDNIGIPELINGQPVVQHGSFSYLPAEDVSVKGSFINGEYFLEIKGKMTFSALFGHKIAVYRTLKLSYLGDDLEISDQIVNEGFVEDRYMIMYHTNLGYPLLSEKTALTLDAVTTQGIGEVDVAHCQEFTKPSPGKKEECFLHTLTPGWGKKACVKNENMTLELWFDATEQPYVFQWKSMASADYVLGLEPVTTPMPEKRFKTLAPNQISHQGVLYRFRHR